MTDRRRRQRPTVPPPLSRLKQAGQRVRYHGFWLGESDRDRVVARFIDEYEGDVSERIKELLYQEATGAQGDDIQRRLDELSRAVSTIQGLLEKGVLVPSPGHEDTVQGARTELDATHNALLNFDT